MSHRFLIISSLAVLGGCSYAIDSQIQDLTIVTPGATDAVCYVYINNLRYKFHPPETQSVSKSEEDVLVDCLAPGNRRNKVVVQAQIEKSTYANVANGGVGAVWDYASGAMFKYPDIIEVSFVNTPVLPEDLPAQNNPDIKQPEEYILEEFRPGAPRMNSDRYRTPSEILRRQKPEPMGGGLSSGSLALPSDTSPGMQPVYSSDKGDVMDAAPPPVPDMNPAGPASGPESPAESTYGPPIPLFPGQ